MSPDSNRQKDLNTPSYKSITFFFNPKSTNYHRRRLGYVTANLAFAVATITANAAVTTGYRQRCHHHPPLPPTILPFFPSLWHGGVDGLPATLLSTFATILSRPEEKMARSGRERKGGGGQPRERGLAKHTRCLNKSPTHIKFIFFL
ncbi:hypothetical protein Scep_016490 [Stephania cephalantha]|uniref:Uncharacterized protein n=1 Tax=Stephania cephalantha TaxID=152367 RepID=A0AAP0IPN3_9MAGN